MSDNVDESDPAVVYSGEWTAYTDSMRDFRGTGHHTSSVNAKATFTFHGIGATVIGAIRAGETPRSSYSVDGSSPVIFQSPLYNLTEGGALFYTSPILRNGQHTLVVTNLDSTSSLFLDYFTVIRGDSSDTGTSDSSSTSTTIGRSTITTLRISSSTTSVSTGRVMDTSSMTGSGTSETMTTISDSAFSSISTATATATASATPSNTVTDSASRTVNYRQIAIMVGSFVSVVAIVALGIGLWFYRRRRKQRKQASDSDFRAHDAPPPPATSTTQQVASGSERPLSPPGYAFSEPPAYAQDADLIPSQLADSRMSQRPEKSTVNM